MTTEKENYLKVLRGEQPEWVPNYWTACQWGGSIVYENQTIPGTGNPNKRITDVFGFEHNDRERFTNMFGVEMTMTIDGSIPTPGKIALTDITKWREQLKYPFPDLDKIDFKAQAEGFYTHVVNHDEKAVAYLCGELFVNLINAMGVAEALCAMVEEPEAVHDFFKEWTEFEIKRLRLSAPHFKPDVVLMLDDVATARDLFMSPELYSEMIAPYHRQIAKAALELGCFVEMHCCGKCEKLIPQWIDMGISIWQPAQPVNDLHAIKAKYGNKLVLNGCWDVTGRGGMTGAPEEVVRETVRETIDDFAPGGGYVFWDTGITGGDVQKFEWTADEANKYGKTVYKKQYN